MKFYFYVKPTEEHQNEKGEYALIKEGTLKFFTGNTYDETPKGERDQKHLNQEHDEILEFKVDESAKTKAFKVILEGSDTYKSKPLDPNILTRPCIYTSKECHQILRFPKHNQKRANIGILKAYKKAFLQDNLSNKQTLDFKEDLTSLSNPHNEIYTIDLEQEIQLKAFVYEEQRTKVPKNAIIDKNTQIARNYKEEQGNITKTIIKDKYKFNHIAEENIQWAFKIVNGSYLENNNSNKKDNTRNEAFPTLNNKQTFRIAKEKTKENTEYTIDCPNITIDNQENQPSPKLNTIPQGYVELENLKGDCINLSLKDLFENTFLESLVGKNIIFFAYVNSPAYCFYKDNGKKYNRIITQDRVTSIELKILKTRFHLEFDGETLTLLENKRELKQWSARSGIPLPNLQEDSKENKQRQRFCIKDTQNTSYYYDLNLHKEERTKPTKEGKYEINLTYNANRLHLKEMGIDLLGLQEDFCKTLQFYKIPENLSIPLKVKYQKRILILIERFKETTESTKARMNIFIDKKRVDKNGNLTNESLDSTLNITDPYAYILERNGPDCIGGELKLRIPSGRYEAVWHNGIMRKETLRLYNDFISKERAILIHEGYTKQNSQNQEGTSPRNTFGCLVIAKNEVVDKNNHNLFADNILQADSSKKEELARAILDKNGFMQQALFSDKQIHRAQEITDNIEVRIENCFETKKQNLKEEIPPNVIRIETQDNSEEFIEIILPEEEQDLWDKTLDTAQNIGSYVVDGLDIIGNIPLPQAKILKAPKLIRNGYNFAKKTLKLKSKYATRQEVLDALKDKYKLETSAKLNKKGIKKDNGEKFDNNTNTYIAKDNKQIKEIWEDITEGAEVLDDKGPDSYGDMIKRRKLSDETILQLRKKSKSKGSAIEINKKDEEQIKIHNKAGEDGD